MDCKNCNKTLSNNIKKYCDNKCQADYKYKTYIGDWKKGKLSGLRAKYFLSKHIRRYLLEIHHEMCQRCSWSKKNPLTNMVPLEVHHKDGNPLNNKPDNLELLCPNCHSLTHNYKALNPNGIRTYRKAK